MSSIQTYSIADQERMIREAMPAAAYRLASLLHRKQKALIELAIKRGTGLGAAQYGDTSWHYNRDRIELEACAELADGIFYEGIYHAVENGWIPEGVVT